MNRLYSGALFIALSVTLLFAGVVISADAPQKKILLASTIGPIDAGIVSALEEAFTKKTGIAVEHTGAGTGKAIQMAETGQYDLLLVHAKALEEKFVADGFGTKRYDLMYNDFVILGPSTDPAKVKGMKDSAAALRKIMEAKALFVTRGDKSGTHVKELEVWKKAGVEPQGAWYHVFEQGAKGNAPTLAFTNEKQAYTIMDRATYITMKSKITLQILVERECYLRLQSGEVPPGPPRRSNAVRGLAAEQGCPAHHPRFRQGQVRRAPLLPELTGRKETLTLALFRRITE